MAFVQPITIRDAVDNVDKKNYLLPAIQREFVWSTGQIERLFDSLMRDYPISSFLFWEVEKENIRNYQFYEFIRNYHERDNKHNPKADLRGESEIIAILDGQQRLTSLYIGLKGTYTYKLRRKRWDNDSAFPTRKLYLNLVSPSDIEDLEFNFRFLTEEESQRSDDNHFWFVVGDILDFEEEVDVNNYLMDSNILSLGSEKFKFANRTLFKLYGVVHKEKSINFFLEKGESLDKVLDIFIRVNSGGTQLSYSDLLLSIATAQWKEKDAREEITTFVDEINAIGDGFNINKDSVLKNCLVLGGFTNIAFKVENFTRDNMLVIEKKWEKISRAIKASFVLVARHGYHRDTLTSYNALIPIATYLYKIRCPDDFTESSKYQEDRERIFKWLVMVLLKRTFSGQPDNVLRPIREVINSNPNNGFPIDDIVNKLKGSPRPISFDDDEIDNLMYYQYAQSHTYSALALIYPTLDFRNKFHQDHIFPKKLFTRKELAKRGIVEDKIEFYLDNCNRLANLQLLEGMLNQEKSGKDFSVWMKEKYPTDQERKAYREKHYIPDIALSLENFEEFIEERKKLIVAEYQKLL